MAVITKEHTIAVLESLIEMIKSEQTQQPEQPRLERWKPQQGDYFYAVFLTQATRVKWDEMVLDKGCYNAYNCYQTQEEAEKEALRTRARRKLEWFARKLNEGKERGSYVYIVRTDGITDGYSANFCDVAGAIYFYTKTDAEYALSQMTQEELESLK